MEESLAVLTRSDQNSSTVEEIDGCSLVDSTHFILALPPQVKYITIFLCCLCIGIDLIFKYVVLKYVGSIKLKDQPINVIFIFDQVSIMIIFLLKCCSM